MTKISLIKMVLVSIICTSSFILPQTANAGAKPIPIKGVGYQVNASMEDNIKTLVGKKVTIYLDSGSTLSGYLKEAGNHLIHLEKLDRKNFFDALIKMDKIIAIDAQFKQYE